MNKAKYLSLILAGLLMLPTFITGCSVSPSAEDPADTGAENDNSSYFSDGDFREAYLETPDAVITLSGNTGTLSDSTRGSSGSVVKITSKGVYLVQGSSEGVQIVVDEGQKTGNIYLVFENVSMTNEGPCVYVADADKVIFQSVGTSALNNTKSSDGAIYSKDDISFSGNGTFEIISAKHGIEGNDDIVITGGTISITADNAGIRANDSIRIGGGIINVSSGKDGLKVDSDEGTGYFVMTDGTVTVDAGYDAVDIGTSEPVEFTGFISLEGGELHLTAGGGQAYPSSETSQKGLKCDGNIYFRGADIDISSSDDAFHSARSILIESGNMTLACSDDGISSDAVTEIAGGRLSITKSYEGIDAESVIISGGEIFVISSDDGINTSVEMGAESQGISLSGTQYSVGDIRITDGSLHIDAMGDGLDSNCSIYIEGGTVIVEGPSNNGNCVFDFGDGDEHVLSITGGYVLGTGSGGKIRNFNAGTQPAALMYFPSAGGDTLSVNDGTGWSVGIERSFVCVIYSSPGLKEGETYTVTYGDKTQEFSFADGLYYDTSH